MTAAQHQCKQEGKIAAQGEQIKGISETIDEFKKDIKADIQLLFRKIDENPSWKVTAALSGALGSALTFIGVCLKIIYSK